MVDFNPVARVTPTFDPVAKVVKPTPQPKFDPVAKVVKPPSAPTPKPAPKPPPKPLQQKRTQDLGQRIRAIEQRVQVIETRREAEAVKEQLADISDAITLLKPCIIENTGENRMAIFDKLESLERQVAALNGTMDEQTGIITDLQNDLNEVTVRTERLSWVKDTIIPQKSETYQPSSSGTSAGAYRYSTSTVLSGHSGYRSWFDWNAPNILHSSHITVQSVHIWLEAKVSPTFSGVFEFCTARRGSTDLIFSEAYSDPYRWSISKEDVIGHARGRNSTDYNTVFKIDVDDEMLRRFRDRNYTTYTAQSGTTHSGDVSIASGADPEHWVGLNPVNGWTIGTRGGMRLEYWYTLNNQAGA